MPDIDTQVAQAQEKVDQCRASGDRAGLASALIYLSAYLQNAHRFDDAVRAAVEGCPSTASWVIKPSCCGPWRIPRRVGWPDRGRGVDPRPVRLADGPIDGGPPLLSSVDPPIGSTLKEVAVWYRANRRRWRPQARPSG